MLQRVADQIRRDLAQPVGVADHGHRLERVRGVVERGQLHEPRRHAYVRVPYGLGRHAEQVDRMPGQRPLLVEPGQQQQVVDEQPHPPDLALDAAHRLVQLRAGRGAAAPVQLGEALYRRQRRTQLVRRVREELPQALLRCRTGMQGGLDPARASR